MNYSEQAEKKLYTWMQFQDQHLNPLRFVSDFADIIQQ